MSAALLEALARPLVSTALLWRLDRADGVALGFTTHDRDLRHGGLVHRASPGATISAITARAGFDDDGISVQGPVSGAGLSAPDIALGRWQDARLAVDLIDWDQPFLGTIGLFRGRVTGMLVAGASPGRFELEAQRELALLANRGALRAAPMCRAALGDRRCGVDMEARTLVVTVLDAAGGTIVLADPPADPAAFAHGRARFITGPYAGIEAEIMAADADGMRLRRIPGADLAGARVRIWEGCDKRFQTCVTRFGNAMAFDGEPHLPGRDSLVRYGAP